MSSTTEEICIFQKVQTIKIELSTKGAYIKHLRFYEGQNEPFQIEELGDTINLFEKFYNFENRDKDEYGSYMKGSSDAQKRNIFKRIILDMLEYFSKLLNKFKSHSLYRYAKWYCKRYEKIENLRGTMFFDYSEYVTYKTCLNILGYSYFILEDDKFELVEF